MQDHVTTVDRQLIREAGQLALNYFLNPDLHNGGLVRDSARPGQPCSIAAAGFACAAFVAAESLEMVDRQTSLRHCLDVARVFRDLPANPSTAKAAEASAYKGLFYHFLEADGPRRGLRAWKSEASTIDTALLVAGLLVARGHFDRENEQEHELRLAATSVIDNVNWRAFV